MKIVEDRPSGYRELGEVLHQSEKAIRFRYYRWEIWIPKSALVKVKGGPYAAPAWAIDSAKEHDSAKFNYD